MITDSPNIIGVLVQLQKRFEHRAGVHDAKGDRRYAMGESSRTYRAKAAECRAMIRELERTINGELPPPEGEVWEEQEEEQS